MRQLYERQASKVALGLWGAGQMMFNKYLILTPASTNIRAEEEMAWLMRNCDMRKSLIRSEGIYDVLDHATTTCGYGGKIALDLTTVAEREDKIAFDSEKLPKGIVANTTLLEKWGTLLLFADNDLKIEASEVAKATNCNFVAIFDSRAEQMSANDLLWLGAANTEPTRDITLQGSILVIDARAKHPGATSKNPTRWPNVVTADKTTIELVNSRWAEYGIGKRVTSPSEHYAALKLSEGAEWQK
jgi:4-hydroxy-3-polyprenylbenzoate decarboxylase